MRAGPRRAVLRLLDVASSAEKRQALEVEVHDCAGEHVRVEPVEDAAVAWDERPGVLDAGIPLEDALDEIAEDGGAADDGAEGGGREV